MVPEGQKSRRRTDRSETRSQNPHQLPTSNEPNGMCAIATPRFCSPRSHLERRLQEDCRLRPEAQQTLLAPSLPSAGRCGEVRKFPARQRGAHAQCRRPQSQQRAKCRSIIFVALNLKLHHRSTKPLLLALSFTSPPFSKTEREVMEKAIADERISRRDFVNLDRYFTRFFRVGAYPPFARDIRQL